MRRFTILSILLLLASRPAWAESLAIVGGEVHPVSGEPYVGNVVVEGGRIAAAGPDAAVPEGARVIDATGRRVVPGFMDAFSQVGLLEVGSVSATDDRTELGDYHPHLEAATAIHPDSDLIGVARSTGLTHALVAPTGGRGGGEGIPGRATLVDLDGWTVEEMTVRPSAALVVAWPAIRTRSFDFTTFSFRETPYADAEKKAQEKVNELRDWFDAAIHYRRAADSTPRRVEPNPKLEHLSAFLDGDGKVIIQADAKRDIEAALDFASEYELDLVLAGGRDAWELAPRLAEEGVPVVLGAVQALPNEEDDPYDRRFDTAGELVRAGVKIAFGSFGSPHSARLVPYEVETAVAYGLASEEGLKALTQWPAEIFGVGSELGTIEVGKRANLMLVDGDPLSLRSRVEALIIEGREVDPTDFHAELYERYRSRPRP